MVHWKKWIWPGILACAILSAIALYTKSDLIQQDLAERAKTGLEQAGLNWASVTLDGRDAIISGAAPSENAQKLAETTVLNTWDVRIVKNITGLIAAQSPYVLAAKLSGDTVELTGFAPDENVSKSIAEAAQSAFPGKTIANNLTLARGALDSFADMTTFGLSQLAGLSEGEVSLSDSSLSLSGVARDRGTYDQIAKSLAEQLPSGLQQAENEVAPPLESPFNWSVDYSGNKVELNGFVPSADIAGRLVEAAKTAFPGAEVVDSQLLASGAPAQFEQSAIFAIGQLSRFSTGNASLSGTEIAVNGTAKSPEDYAAALKSIASGNLPEGVSLESSNISPATISPYRWSAKYDGASVKLEGFIPDETARNAVTKAVSDTLPTARLNDLMQTAIGAPAGFSGFVTFAISQLPKFSNGEIALSDNELSIIGTATSTEGYAIVSSDLGNLPAGLKLADTAVTPATVQPYTWAATLDGNSVKLNGHVPDEAIRKEILQKVASALPDKPVQDEMLIAAGAPADFVDMAGFAVKQLRRLNSGTAGISDTQLTLKGVAKDPQNYAVARSVLAGVLPAGLSLAGVSIDPASVSPYAWQAVRDGEKIALSGYIPGEDLRTKIVENVRKTISDAAITDSMLVASGQPAGFDKAVGFATSQLGHFSSGSVSLQGESLAIKGVAADSSGFRAVRSSIAGQLPEGYTLVTQDIVPPTVNPWQWGARIDGEKLAVTGYVPDRATGNAIIVAARSAFPPQTQVEDSTNVAAGAPIGFENAAKFAVQQLSQLSSGSASLKDMELAVEGVAGNSQAYADVNAALKGNLPTGMKIAGADISPPSVDPYSWSAIYNGKSVVLGGFIPGKEVRTEMLARVQNLLPQTEIDDQMQVATGQPQEFEQITSGVLAILPRFSQGDIALSGSNLVINGIGKSSANYLAAERFVAAPMAGGARLVSADITPPVHVGNYQWSAAKGGNSIVLSGLVPKKQMRKEIADKAAELNPGSGIINRLTVESGAPEGFSAATRYALSLLDGLSAGTVSMSDKMLDITGTARSVSSFEATQKALEADLPEGFNWGKREITPPEVNPFNWSIDNAGERVSLGGFVPNKDFSNKQADAAASTLGKQVDNRQRIAAGAPDGFDKAVAALIAAVSQLEEASASLTATNAFVQGRALSETDAARISGEIETSLPTGFRLRSQISYPLPKPEIKPEPRPEVVEPDPKPVETNEAVQEKAPEAETEVVTEQPKPEPKPKPEPCNVDFNALFHGETIEFDTARAVIKPESFALLERIAGGLKQCPRSRIEVGGHTDSRGSDSYNKALSEARARSVVVYLTDNAGVPRDNLTSNGYGESQPVASNDLPEDRARNRRIEFKVLTE